MRDESKTMKYCVRPGAAGPRGRALSVSRLGPAASLLILLAGPASADGVSVNWDALGEPAPAEAPLLLRQPGEKQTLPVIRLTPPSNERAVPLPLAKPAIIPQAAGTGPEAPATETAAAQDAAPARAAAAAAAAPAPRPEPEPEAAEPQAPPVTRAEAPSATEAEAAPEDGTFRVALPQAKPSAGETASAAPSPLEMPAEESAAPPALAAAAPETAPEPAAQETETPQAGEPETGTPDQVAALTSPEPALARILFDRDSSAILTSARAELDATAERLKQGSGSTRIQLKAYGGEPGELSSEARKLSLRRALAVYNYLRDQGVLTSRMDVRAFGGTRDTGPTERVDIVVQQR